MIGRGKDGRSFGELFYDHYDELKDISFQYALALIISALKEWLDDHLHLAKPLVETKRWCTILSASCLYPLRTDCHCWYAKVE